MKYLIIPFIFLLCNCQQSADAEKEHYQLLYEYKHHWGLLKDLQSTRTEVDEGIEILADSKDMHGNLNQAEIQLSKKYLRSLDSLKKENRRTIEYLFDLNYRIVAHREKHKGCNLDEFKNSGE